VFDTLYGEHLGDVQCGFRAIHRKALNKLRLSQDGMQLTTELLIELKERGIPICPVQVRQVPTDRSHIREARDFIEHVSLMLRRFPSYWSARNRNRHWAVAQTPKFVGVNGHSRTDNRGRNEVNQEILDSLMKIVAKLGRALDIGMVKDLERGKTWAARSSDLAVRWGNMQAYRWRFEEAFQRFLGLGLGTAND